MKFNNNQQVFFALVKAGLWEGFNENDNLNDNHVSWDDVDWDEVYKLAEEQSVVGLVTAGIEGFKFQDSSFMCPQEWALQFIGSSLQIEQQNKAMMRFTEALVKKMRKTDIYCLLVKGQGIAQCYSRPQWRPSGDIDFFFSKTDYQKAISLLTPLAFEIVQDKKYTKSYGLVIDGWMIELHGTLRNSLSSKMDRMIDAVQEDTFRNRKVRAWKCGETDVFMPDVNNDLFLLFTHFVRHFYKGGISFRQLCDWCRMMWTYKKSLNHGLLESRIKKAGLMNEWRAFAAVAVDYLGMPVDAMPLFNEGENQNEKYKGKAGKIVDMVFNAKPINSFSDKLARAKVFPVNTLKFLPAMLFHMNWMKLKERMVDCN